MKQEHVQLLSLRSLPGRLTKEQVAVYLGFSEADIASLMSRGLLVPLGNPAPNGPKFFSAVEVTRLREDPKWLSRATAAVTKHWYGKNQAKRSVKHGNAATSPEADEEPTGSES